MNNTHPNPSLSVRQLQYMLHRLAQVHPQLPSPPLDGRLGEATLEALMTFQREFCPRVTGTPDPCTVGLLARAWREAEQLLAESRPLRCFPAEGYRALPGEEADFLILPQTMFRVLARFFSGLTPTEADGVHEETSADNLRWLQRAAGLPEDGVLSVRSWELLCRLYELAVVWAPEHRRKARSGGWG